MPWLNPRSGEVLSGPVLTTRTGIVVTTQAARIPLKVLIPLKLAQGMLMLVWWCVKHWWLTAPVAIVGYLWLRYGWFTAFGCVLGTATGLVGWWHTHPASFATWLAFPYQARARRLMLGRVWRPTMVTAGLATSYEGKVRVPVLRKVRCDRWRDMLTVRMVSGQIPQDFVKAAPRIAHAFGVQMVKVSFGRRTDEIMLHLLRGDPLARVVGPLAVTAVPDFGALPMGVQESGELFALRLYGCQILAVGATGAGKASVAWSFIRALAGGVSCGLVRLWVFDPKGGMELAAGAPMFDRFHYDEPDRMAGSLEQAVRELKERTARLRGITRQHLPSVKEPLTVIVIDELAALTAYADKQARERIKNALALILTQGRAVGFHVLALVQDPRKDVVPFRDLFTTRIGLRMNEPEQVDLTMGDGARERGAWCDQISQHTPGVAYVVLDEHPVPVRVRMSYLTDVDIAAMASTYSRAGIVNSTTVPGQSAHLDVNTPGWTVNR